MKSKREEIDYFDTFIKNSEYALEETKILKDFIWNYDINKTIEIENIVHKIENEADDSHHKLINFLISDFLPPIEREDIINLSHRIDDLVDNIDEIVINFNILNIEKIRVDVTNFINLLERCCIDVYEMLTKFKNLKKFDEIKEKVIIINNLEDEGDKLYQNAIKDLYKDENNPIDVIRWTTIYNCLEECFDSCERIADCVEEIIMKNS